MKTLLAGLLGLTLLAGSAAKLDAQDRYRDRDERPVVEYQVVRTRLVTRTCENCAYRRGGYSGLGVYRIETRIYTELQRGHVLRTWRGTEEFFDHCVR